MNTTCGDVYKVEEGELLLHTIGIRPRYAEIGRTHHPL